MNVRETLDELPAYRETTKLAELAFRRACSNHYISVVLPELHRFEQHLQMQDFLVALNQLEPLGKHALQAGLLIEFPVDTTNLLEIRYDYTSQTLTFSQLFAGHRNQQPDCEFAYDSLAQVGAMQVYDIIEGFVASVEVLQVEKRILR
jgi:hypothetical protein